MKRILIVDDAIDLGRLLQDALKTIHPDIPISVVPSAEEALLESTRFTIDVLVTDLRLPGMSGLELIRKIRVRQPNVKIILMTGLNPEDRLYKQKEEFTLDVFLRKPIMTPAFLDAVDQLLGEAPAEPKLAVDKPAAKNQANETQAQEKPNAGKPAPKNEKLTAQEALLQELGAVMPGLPVEDNPKPASSRQPAGRPTTASLSLSSPQDGAPAETGLSAILSRLRSSLGAISVMLLDDRGKSVAQAGDLPDLQVEGQLASPLMASLSAGAKVSYLLGQPTTQMVQAYRGTSFDLVAAPIGQYVLLAALPTGRSTLRLALAFEEVLNAQAELSAALEAMGLRVYTAIETGAPEVLMAEMSAAGGQNEADVPPGAPETPPEQDPGWEKFEELFARKKTGELRMQDADSFWDSASSESKDVSQPGVLTFEQAQKLGLLPPDSDE